MKHNSNKNSDNNRGANSRITDREQVQLQNALLAVNNRQWVSADRLSARILERRPRNPEALMIQAVVAQQQAKWDRALFCAREAEQAGYQPRVVVLNLLGQILLQTGRWQEALECLQKSVQLNPLHGESWYLSGNAQFLLKRYTEAEMAFSQVLMLEPGHVEAQLNRAVVWRIQGKLQFSLLELRDLTRRYPADERIAQELAKAATEAGEHSCADQVWADILSRNPRNYEALSGRIFGWNYVYAGTAEQRVMHTRQLMQQFSENVRIQNPEVVVASWNIPTEPTILNVGLVSGDMGQHPVGYFLSGFWGKLDRARVAVHVFSTCNHEDVVADFLKSGVSSWTEVGHLSSAEIAERVRSRRIHLLIDLSGHTRNNRLDVFVLRPAPVQLSWLGYFATTGLAEMDYIWVDRWVCPPEQPHYLCEKPVYMDPSYRCFQMSVINEPVSPAPSMRAGFITLGCFNNLSKLNDAVLRLWGRIVSACPQSRLLLKSRQLNQMQEQQQMQQRCAALGIPVERLLLEGSSGYAEYLHAYSRVDMALDPFPYTGATISLEGLWMGVPLVTLAGTDLLGRSGVTILGNIGLESFIAHDPDEYVLKAVEWINKPEALALLRLGMRERLRSSVLMDGQDFAKRWMQACWDLWRLYREGVNT